VDRVWYLGPEGTAKQTAAVISWMTPGNPGHSYERLDEPKIPVFVASGWQDIVVPTANSVVLWRRIKTSHFHVYPDVGHGFLNEYADMFAEHIKLFLDGDRVM
jgi:pimeloyl-ACP methyl ester carboxylesterase